MSTVGDVKSLVKLYLQRNLDVSRIFPGVTDETLLDTNVDALLLRAINNARKWAEMMHDFVDNEVLADVTVPAGQRLELAGLTDKLSEDEFDLNGLNEVLYNGWPIELGTYKNHIRSYHRRGRFDRTRGVTHANYLWFEPALSEDVTLELVGTRWMADYSADEDTDWMLDKGFEFFQWRAMIEVNHLVQVFLPRTEGALPVPEKPFQLAWAALTEWDDNRRAAKTNMATI